MSFAGWITLITTVVMTGISGMILYDRHQKKNAPVVIITEFEDGTHYKAKSMDYYSNI